MKYQKQKNGDSPPSHRQGSKVGLQMLLVSIADRPSCTRLLGQTISGPHMRHNRPYQPQTRYPQEVGAGKNRMTNLAQTFGILIKIGWATKHFEIAIHVKENKANPNQAGDGHNHLFAN
jgi:hypothetical protein